MKIILSRKGFDSSLGKVPSPILPSGAMWSLPIREEMPTNQSKRYDQIRAGKHSLGVFVNDLTKGKVHAQDIAHLDPDLDFDSLPRLPGWRPMFGQAKSAEGHLQIQNVNDGDIFLFYGWFKRVEQFQGKYRYVFGAPDLHVIFGWLQIERRISIDNITDAPDWALEHPHYKRQKYHNLDSLYIATNRLCIANTSIDQPGGGVFRQFHPDLCLTDALYTSRSIWKLPMWFYPEGKKSTLSYHGDLGRWKKMKDYVQLTNVCRGQEFVLDCEHYPESIEWLASILSKCNLSQT
jgi:hypothetical protein